MLNFVKHFFCIDWQEHMVLFFYFINVMHCTDWFVNVEPALQPRNESHLIMVYNSFFMLLNSICWYLVENFCIHIYQRYWSIVLFFCWVSVWFGNQSNAGFIEWVWKFSFPFYFLEQLEKDRYYLCFKCLVEFPRV